MRAQTSTLTQVWVLMRPRSSWSWWREIQTITQRSGKGFEPPFGRRAYLVKLAAFEPRMDVSCHLKFELSVLAPDMEYDRSSKKKRAQDCVFHKLCLCPSRNPSSGAACLSFWVAFGLGHGEVCQKHHT